jgi:hypothetical protein
MMKTSDVTESAKDAQNQYFSFTDEIPGEAWYWAALVSIVASAILFASNRRDWSLFVGQWPPTFLLLGVFHKLLHTR